MNQRSGLNLPTGLDNLVPNQLDIKIAENEQHPYAPLSFERSIQMSLLQILTQFYILKSQHNVYIAFIISAYSFPHATRLIIVFDPRCSTRASDRLTLSRPGIEGRPVVTAYDLNRLGFLYMKPIHYHTHLFV